MRLSLKPKLKTDYINLFICGLLVLPVIFKLFESFNLGSTQIITYGIYGILWLCLALHVSQNISSVLYISLIVTVLALFICTLESLIFPDNNAYIWGFDARLLVTFVPYNLFGAILLVIPGLLVSDFDSFIDILHTVSRIGVAIGAVAYFLFVNFGGEINYDDMNFSYTLCIFVCTLIATNRKRDVWFVAVGFACMFIAGTRGPLVCTIVAMILNIILNQKKNRTFIYIIVGVVAILLVQSNVLGTLLNLLGNVLSSIGITNLRLIDFYNEGNIADTSGRNNLQDIVLDAVYQRPFLGLGVGADRMLIDGSYVHNILIETISSFGVIFGGLFLLCLTVVIIRALFSKNKSLKIIAFIFLTSVVLKLMFSSSFINCREFSFLLGVCISGIMKERKQRKTPVAYQADVIK